MTIEAGKTYRVTYGNGSQLFHVVRITKKGKPFGFRLHGDNFWFASSMKVNDVRFHGEWTDRFNLRRETIPALPAVRDALHSKADLAALKAAITSARADLDAFDAENVDPVYPAPADRTGETMEAYYTAHKEIRDRRDVFLNPLGSAERSLARAKIENTLVARPDDLTSF